MPDIFQNNLLRPEKKDLMDVWIKENKETLSTQKPVFDVYDVNMAGIADKSIGDKVKLFIDYKIIKKDKDFIFLEVQGVTNADMVIS